MARRSSVTTRKSVTPRRRGHRPRALQLHRVPLAVGHRQAHRLEARRARHGQAGGGVEPAREQHHRLLAAPCAHPRRALARVAYQALLHRLHARVRQPSVPRWSPQTRTASKPPSRSAPGGKRAAGSASSPRPADFRAALARRTASFWLLESSSSRSVSPPPRPCTRCRARTTRLRGALRVSTLPVEARVAREAVRGEAGALSDARSRVSTASKSKSPSGTSPVGQLCPAATRRSRVKVASTSSLGSACMSSRQPGGRRARSSPRAAGEERSMAARPLTRLTPSSSAVSATPRKAWLSPQHRAHVHPRGIRAAGGVELRQHPAERERAG